LQQRNLNALEMHSTHSTVSLRISYIRGKARFSRRCSLGVAIHRINVRFVRRHWSRHWSWDFRSTRTTLRQRWYRKKSRLEVYRHFWIALYAYACTPYTAWTFSGAAFVLCAVGLFAHSELSHTRHTGSLLVSPTFFPLLPPVSPVGPTIRPRSLWAPQSPLAAPRPSRIHSSFPRRRRRCRRSASHGPSPFRYSASFLRPLRPQADSPGRSAELTVSTAGWLVGVATQPATFLFSRVCSAGRSGFTWRYLPACSLSSLTSLRATGSESCSASVRPSVRPSVRLHSTLKVSPLA